MLCACVLSRVRLFATPGTVALQAPPSMEFSRREYWSGFLFPTLGDLPDPGIEPGSLALLADSLLSESPGKKLVLGIRQSLVGVTPPPPHYVELGQGALPF